MKLFNLDGGCKKESFSAVNDPIGGREKRRSR
jgi:hypothetical protein